MKPNLRVFGQGCSSFQALATPLATPLAMPLATPLLQA